MKANRKRISAAFGAIAAALAMSGLVALKSARAPLPVDASPAEPAAEENVSDSKKKAAPALSVHTPPPAPTEASATERRLATIDREIARLEEQIKNEDVYEKLRRPELPDETRREYFAWIHQLSQLRREHLEARLLQIERKYAVKGRKS